MRITKRQLKRIIREESKGSTKKYDDDSALRGDQDELPDALQKGIIDKTVTDREEKEKNESFRVTKRQLRRIIKEALAGPPQTAEGWMYWGGGFGLSAEEDNDGQTIFYLSADQPDRARIAAEAVKAGAQVDTDYEGNDIIYTGVYEADDWDQQSGRPAHMRDEDWN